MMCRSVEALLLLLRLLCYRGETSVLLRAIAMMDPEATMNMPEHLQGRSGSSQASALAQKPGQYSKDKWISM